MQITIAQNIYISHISLHSKLKKLKKYVVIKY
jgi:hypothetical protein